jgi:hypothetical protein
MFFIYYLLKRSKCGRWRILLKESCGFDSLPFSLSPLIGAGLLRLPSPRQLFTLTALYTVSVFNPKINNLAEYMSACTFVKYSYFS